MGFEIAQSCAMAGKFNSITLNDISQDQLDRVQKAITANIASLAKKQINLYKRPEDVAARIQTTTRVEKVKDKNLLIIETIPEILDLKQNLFKYLNEIFKGDDTVIFTTNNSTLSVGEIGKYIEDKTRFAGLRFYIPVLEKRFVEIHRQPETSRETCETLQHFVADLDKDVKDDNKNQ